MNKAPHDPETATDSGHNPIALLAGMFIGFASVLLTFGFLWPFAPLFPAVTAAAAWAIPFKHHSDVARGAFYSALGVVAFEVAFLPFLLLT